jgi:hypothetical protein
MKPSRKSPPRSPNASAAEPPADGFNALDKEDLHHLADRLLFDEPSAIATCIEFIEAETKDLWHGRARAMMCRRLKHCSLNSSQRARLVSCVTERLCSGRFSEQFRDQLRLALHLDSARVHIVAHSCAHDHRDYVRRYAAWLLTHRPEATGNA